MYKRIEGIFANLGKRADRRPARGLAILMGLVFIAFFLISLRFTGPAYLSDEIGYLTKAIAISGDPVSFPTKWYGGYSFFLAPVFIVLGSPKVEWYGIMAINALLWSLSAGLLYSLLRNLFKNRRPSTVLLVVALSMMYPSWLIVSGYAS